MSYLDEGETEIFGLDTSRPISPNEEDVQAVRNPDFTAAYNEGDAPEETEEEREAYVQGREDDERASGEQYEVVETRPADHPWKPKPQEVVFTGTQAEAEEKLQNLERRHANDKNTYAVRKA